MFVARQRALPNRGDTVLGASEPSDGAVFARVLEAQNKMLATGMSREEAEMAAFELNSKDAARLHGK